MNTIDKSIKSLQSFWFHQIRLGELSQNVPKRLPPGATGLRRRWLKTAAACLAADDSSAITNECIVSFKNTSISAVRSPSRREARRVVTGVATSLRPAVVRNTGKSAVSQDCTRSLSSLEDDRGLFSIGLFRPIEEIVIWAYVAGIVSLGRFGSGQVEIQNKFVHNVGGPRPLPPF